MYDELFPGKENLLDKGQNTDEIRNELKELNKVSRELKSLTSVTIDENYFTTLLPRFRELQQKKKYQFSLRKLVFSSSLAFSTVIVLLFTFQFVQTGNSKIEVSPNQVTVNSTATVPEDSYIASADQFSDSIVNDRGVQREIDKSIYQSLAVQTEDNNFVLIKSDNDYDKVLSQLDENELETVYAQLQQTKIL